MRQQPSTSTLFPYTTLFRSMSTRVDASASAFRGRFGRRGPFKLGGRAAGIDSLLATARSEEHTSELQSHSDLVCRLLLEKKNDYENRLFRRLIDKFFLFIIM